MGGTRTFSEFKKGPASGTLTLAPSPDLRYHTHQLHLSLCPSPPTSSQPITGQYPNLFQAVAMVYHLFALLGFFSHILGPSVAS